MSWKADVFQDIIVPSDFVRIKTFPDGQLVQFESVKYALFTDKFGLGDCLRNLSPAAVTYQ